MPALCRNAAYASCRGVCDIAPETTSPASSVPVRSVLAFALPHSGGWRALVYLPLPVHARACVRARVRAAVWFGILCERELTKMGAFQFWQLTGGMPLVVAVLVCRAVSHCVVSFRVVSCRASSTS